jgi:tripartite-type tricarboxylate transporter receptor subunit TctC
LACHFGRKLAAAQTYPNKPVRIVTAGVGAEAICFASDRAEISGGLGQQVIVDNRPSGVIPGEVAPRRRPDGYTLLVSSNVLWLEPYLHQKVHYDAMRIFYQSQPGRSPIFSSCIHRCG